MSIQEIVICQVPMQHPDIRNILRQVKESGATSVQIYTFWKDFEPRREGEFDWTYFDGQVRLIREAGLRWVPFVLIGPKYAAPDWWLKDPRHKGLVCLEHGKESPIDSIWSEGIREQVDRVMKAFAEHYLPMDVLESVQPGICGDYGESIMPVHGNWPGDYHTHQGFWCGDPDAVASLQKTVKARYGTVEALNKAWNSHYASFSDVVPVLPHKVTSRTQYFDQLAWYRDSMTEFVDFWMKTCRKYLPDTPLYMCTGGNEDPHHASDFAAQAKVCARYHGGIRLTNECNRFIENYFNTAYTHSACEFYGAYLGLEPVGPLTPEGVRARLFGSAVYGNRQMMFYYGNLFRDKADENGSYGTDRSEAFTKSLDLLSEHPSESDVAFFWPGRMGGLGSGIPGGIWEVVPYLRSLTPIMPVNELMIRDGALAKYKLLIIPCDGFTDRETLLCMVDYVKKGGVIFSVGRLADLELEPVREFDALFGITPDSDMGFGGAYYPVVDKERFPGLAERRGYGASRGWMGLDRDTIPITQCPFNPNNYSGTTTASMMNFFMKEYPAGNGKTGAALAYFGPREFHYDPQALNAQQPVFSIVLQDVLSRYTDVRDLHTEPGEQARGYINGELYALLDDGQIVKKA